jgi:hypothetical protein
MARMGRPPKPADQRKSRVVKFRARGELVERLQAAAEAGGYSSLSEYIERTLEKHLIMRDAADATAEIIRQEWSQIPLQRVEYAPRGDSSGDFVTPLPSTTKKEGE